MHSRVRCHTTPRLGKGEAKYIALTRVKPSRAGGWFRAAFHFRVSVKSNFGSFRKANNCNNGSVTPKWSTIAKKWTWDLPWQGAGEGRDWEEHRLVSSAEEILLALPNHIECWKKKSVPGKKKYGRILASSLQSLVFLGNTLFISTSIEVRPI